MARKGRTIAKTEQCGECGEFFSPQGIGGHMRKHDGSATGEGSLRAPRAEDRPDQAEIYRANNPERPVSHRPRFARHSGDELVEPIGQLPDMPNIRDSAGGFVLDPQGATIPEIISWYPVGAGPDDGVSAKYTVNYADYRARYITGRGKEWLGPRITGAHVSRIIEVMERNRADEIQQCQWDIEQAEKTLGSMVSQEVRNQAAKRIDQLNRRLRSLRQLIDKDKIVAELETQARAKRMAALSPEQREAVMLMLEGQESNRFRDMVAREVLHRMQPEGEDDPDLQPVGVSGTIRHTPEFDGTADEFQGKDFIDVENV